MAFGDGERFLLLDAEDERRLDLERRLSREDFFRLKFIR